MNTDPARLFPQIQLGVSPTYSHMPLTSQNSTPKQSPPAVRERLQFSEIPFASRKGRRFNHNRDPGQARDRAIADWPEGRGSGPDRVKAQRDHGEKFTARASAPPGASRRMGVPRPKMDGAMWARCPTLLETAHPRLNLGSARRGDPTLYSRGFATFAGKISRFSSAAQRHCGIFSPCASRLRVSPLPPSSQHSDSG